MPRGGDFPAAQEPEAARRRAAGSSSARSGKHPAPGLQQLRDAVQPEISPESVYRDMVNGQPRSGTQNIHSGTAKAAGPTGQVAAQITAAIGASASIGMSR